MSTFHYYRMPMTAFEVSYSLFYLVTCFHEIGSLPFYVITIIMIRENILYTVHYRKLGSHLVARFPSAICVWRYGVDLSACATICGSPGFPRWTVLIIQITVVIVYSCCNSSLNLIMFPIMFL